MQVKIDILGLPVTTMVTEEQKNAKVPAKLDFLHLHAIPLSEKDTAQKKMANAA